MKDIHVLIVEDDAMVAEINKKYTEAVEGYVVDGLVFNGSEAIEQIQQLKPDVVILDNYLPETNGLEILQALRSQDKPIDIIMITAADDVQTVKKAVRQGVVAYITKPFKFERYRAVLEAYRDNRLRIKEKERFNQEEIDELIAVGSGRTNQEAGDMPKNFNSQTRDLIINFLVGQSEASSAEQVAATVGVSRVTARRYLEYMLEQGQVVRSMDYLTVGRPVHRFKLKRI